MTCVVPQEAAGLVRALLTADRNQQYLRLKMTEEQRAATPAVDFRLSILAHHDDRRRICSLKRQNQVQQDKGIGSQCRMNAITFRVIQMASMTL